MTPPTTHHEWTAAQLFIHHCNNTTELSLSTLRKCNNNYEALHSVMVRLKFFFTFYCIILFIGCVHLILFLDYFLLSFYNNVYFCVCFMRIISFSLYRNQICYVRHVQHRFVSCLTFLYICLLFNIIYFKFILSVASCYDIWYVNCILIESWYAYSTLVAC